MPDPEADPTTDETERREPPSTLMDEFNFETHVVMRLKELKVHSIAVDKRLTAVEAVLSARTLIFNRVLDGFGWAARGGGTFAMKLLESFTKPTLKGMFMWVITLVAMGTLTVSQVTTLSDYARDVWEGEEKPAPVPEPLPEPVVDPVELPKDDLE